MIQLRLAHMKGSVLNQTMKTLTQKRLKEVFSYCPDSGEFTRIRKPGSKKYGCVSSTRSEGYVVIRVDNVLYKSHRLAFLYMQGEFPQFYVDHINGIKDDNRFCNLRLATAAENNQNLRKARGVSKILGATWNSAKMKWHAQVKFQGRNYHFGDFDTPEKAASAYREAKARLHPFSETTPS